LNPYEITYIIRPDGDEEQTRSAVDNVTGRITGLGGELIATYPWNPPRRRMAYPIRDFGDGFYVTTTFRFPTEQLKELERSLRLNTTVLRYLIVQATDLNITQSQQRAQQAAARAAGPPPEQAAPAPAPAPQSAPGQPPAPAPAPAQQAAPQPQAAPAPAPQPAPAAQPQPVVSATPAPETGE
jgi:ribosomal protein S6